MPKLKLMPNARHSALRPDWGTPDVVRQFANCFLRPAALNDDGASIDLDYASSAYWQDHWPGGDHPVACLDGSSGRDVLIEADRRKILRGASCGAGFLNAPGLDGGRMIQRCWEVFERDHRTGWLGSGVWDGFSLEQLASLQGVGSRSPLSCGDGSLITVVPSRRLRYVLHPEAMLALLIKKQACRRRAGPQWRLEQRAIEKLHTRLDDAPVSGPSPTHASYITLLPSRNKAVRRRQLAAARQFLASQKDQPRSPFRRVEVLGSLEP
jgi:hypothetical protein